MMVALSSTGPVASAYFESRDPATDELVGRFAVHGAPDVERAVVRARTAAEWWRAIGEPARRARLVAWRVDLVKRTDELSDLIHRENGKPVADAVLEVTIAVAHLNWAAHHAPKVLGRRSVNPGMLAVNHRATVCFVPFGVVGVIGPWNYPVHTPMGSISYALAAGNAVVFKPSEHTPAVAAWLTESFARTVPERPVLQLVTGRGETGAVLCRSGVDKIAFTGSAATARAVMATCASSLTPVVLECGGKDALIVAEDADLDLAAEQAVWGSMANAGQTCAGVERAYVAEPVFDAFLDRVTARAKQLEVGDDPPADYGAMTVAAQASVISRHIGSALAAGGRAVVGGPAAVRGNRVWPVVLVDVPEECTAMTEETFGPVLVVTKVADAREGVRRANASPYGLGAAVFSARHGNEIADRLDVGMVSINSVLAFAAIPGLPWGGSKESGFGRIHGPEGLREFARSKAVTDQRFTSPLRVMTFDREDRTLARLRGLVRLRWGHG